jgi:hypothetical protein
MAARAAVAVSGAIGIGASDLDFGFWFLDFGNEIRQGVQLRSDCALIFKRTSLGRGLEINNNDNHFYGMVNTE